ncbi:MAG: hypothetical protein QME40_04610 [bacterium]|nr:hypothetical protein [bacterium]
MERTQVLIVGAGKRGSAFIETFHGSEGIRILGVVDIDKTAPGLKLAKRHKIPISDDFRRFIKDANLILNLTGLEDVQAALEHFKPEGSEVLTKSGTKMITDLLMKWKEATVTRRFMGELLSDFVEETSASSISMFNIGKRFSERIEGNLKDHLDTFKGYGLGTLELEEIDEEEGEVSFVGRNLFESYKRSDYPQDHFAKGFLAKTVSKLAGVPEMNCEEMECVARGDEICRFIVCPTKRLKIMGLRKSLEK